MFPGFGDQNPLLAGRAMGSYPMPEAPPTPGPFGAGLPRNEGTIPGIGVAMPLSVQSLDGSDQEQRPQIPGIPLGGAPPLPPGPHPSLLAAGQQQAYQQQQLPPSPFPQQMVPMPMAPPNMNHLQPPTHIPLLPHHLSRPPPPQMASLGMPNMPGSMPMPSSMVPSMPMSIPNPMVKLRPTTLAFYFICRT